MKEARKKKNQKRMIVIIVLILAIAVALGLVFLIPNLTNKDDNNTKATAERYEVFRVDVSKIERIEWQFKGEDYAIYRDGDVWKLSSDPALELYQSACKALASSLEVITTEKFIEDLDRKDIGLEEPSNVVKVRADGQEYELYFGDENSTGGYYYLEYDGKISMVQSYEKTVFDKSILSLTGQEEEFETSLTKVEREESGGEEATEPETEKASDGTETEPESEAVPETNEEEANAGLGEPEPETGILEEEEGEGIEDYTGMPEEEATFEEDDDIAI